MQCSSQSYHSKWKHNCLTSFSYRWGQQNPQFSFLRRTPNTALVISFLKMSVKMYCPLKMTIHWQNSHGQEWNFSDNENKSCGNNLFENMNVARNMRSLLAAWKKKQSWLLHSECSNPRSASQELLWRLWEETRHRNFKKKEKKKTYLIPSLWPALMPTGEGTVGYSEAK